MLYTLESLLQGTDPAIIAQMPGFNHLFTKFQTHLEELRNSITEQYTLTGGYKEQKTKSKQTLITTIREVSTRVQAYAWIAEDKVLYHKVSASKSAILLMTDTSTNAYGRLVHELATEHQAVLAPYGVDIAMLNKLKTAIDDYYHNIPQPRAAQINRMFHTANIERLLKELSHLLVGMDILVRTLEHSQHNFYINYFDAKILVDLPTRRLTIHGKVTNQEDQPVGKVTIEIPALNIKTKSSSIGGFKFKNIPSGMYQITFSQIGYTPKTITIALIKTIATKINVKLNRMHSMPAAS